MIYLDNAATTFPKPDAVYNYVDWVQRNIAVNIGRGSYHVAREAMDIVESAKGKLARLVHANSSESVVITPSATIAANEIIGGMTWDNFKNVYVTPFEHNAVMRPLERMKNLYGANIFILPFDPKTQELDEDEMNRLFTIHTPDYVFINQVSNVTGVIIPVEKIAATAKNYDAVVVVDGSQSVGLLDIDLRKLPVDFLIFAGHKNIYASWGIGGFVINSDSRLQPFITGGTGSDSLKLSVDDLEVGSPNIISIASMDKAIDWLNEIGISSIATHKDRMIRELIEGLKDSKVEMYLPGDLKNHTSVVSFNIPEYEPSEVGIILDQDFDIAVRTGFHCAPLIHKLIGTETKKGTVRVSVGYFNTDDDIYQFVAAVKDI